MEKPLLWLSQSAGVGGAALGVRWVELQLLGINYQRHPQTSGALASCSDFIQRGQSSGEMPRMKFPTAFLNWKVAVTRTSQRVRGHDRAEEGLLPLGTKPQLPVARNPQCEENKKGQTGSFNKS